MPRRNATQMRISPGERSALKLTRQDLRDRRRARIAYKVAHRASVSEPQNPVRWVNP